MTDTPRHRATSQSVWARFWRWLTTVESSGEPVSSDEPTENEWWRAIK